MATIQVPRPHQGRRRAFIFEGSGDVNPWASDVDRTITEIIHSLGEAQRLFSQLTNQTSGAVGAVARHASTHLPNGTDPLTTAAPSSILGGTSSNQKGTANSFARSDHSHDVATAAQSGGYGTAATEGTGNALLRADGVFKYPPALMSLANLATLIFADDGVNTSLTNGLGTLTIDPGGSGYVFITTSGVLGAPQLLQVTPNLNGSGDGIKVTLGAPSGARTGETYRGFNFSAAMAANITSCVHSSADIQFNLTPAAGSGSGNTLYQMRLTGGLINNANASFSEVVQLDISGARRLVASPTVTTSETVRLECPTIGATLQAGMRIRNRTAQVTATDRVGLIIDVHNSGTNRYSAQLENRLRVTNPSGRGENVLDLRQQNTGTGGGAHIGFDDKAGDATSPVSGDFWRNARNLKFYEGTLTHNLTPMTTRGDLTRMGASTEERVALGSSTQFLRSDGTDAIWSDINSLTADSSPDNTADYVMTWDNSAGTHKKVLLNLLGPTIAHGTYTPTRSAETNLDSNVSMTEAQYVRVGGTVVVSGRFTADPTLTTTATSFEMTLPIASNIGAAEDVAGTAFCGNIAAQGAEVIGVAANDTAKVQWKAADVTSQTWSYIFAYQVI